MTSAPEAFNRNANTRLGERIAAMTPAKPATLASMTDREGTSRLLVWTSQRGASPLPASTKSTREQT